MTWILVASRTGAKLFENKGPNEPLEFPKEFQFPQGKIMDKDVYQDQPGRSFNSVSQSQGGHGTSAPRHSLSSEVTPHELSSHKFAKTLAAMLEQGRNAHQFSKLVLVAEARFLGVLKGELSEEVTKQISHTLEKRRRRNAKSPS